MSALEAVAIVFAGMAAGTVNAVAGSGTLITFPVLLAVGYPPLVANVSNNVGLVPGAISGTFGYRRELHGQRHRLRRLVPAAFLGGLAGATLLLVLPSSAFDAIVPVFVATAVLLVAVQPRLRRWVEARRAREGARGDGPAEPFVVLAGAYGGYFGAGQGILYHAILGVLVREDIQRLNAVRNVLAAVVNGTAGVVFVLAADVAWAPAGLIAAGAVVGGTLGAAAGRRLPEWAFRALIVAVGLATLIALLLR